MKAFIVDDEYLQRNLVKMVIPWDEIGVEISGEAEDGEEALEKILKDQPDIIIMDINIPYMNGIEVSQRVKERMPDTQIIILTAYGEFEYARQALQLGAVSFVLKPVNPEELCQEILKCKKRLESVWEGRNSIKQMREEITQKQKERFLLEQISGIAQAEKEENIHAVLKTEPDMQMMMLFLKFPDPGQSGDHAEEIEEMLQDYFPRYDMLEINGDFVFILFGKENMEYHVSMFCAYMQEVMNHQRIFEGGTSLIHKNAAELREAYVEAYDAFRQNRGSGCINKYEPLNMQHFLEAVSYDADELLVKLRQRQYGEFLDKVAGCLQDLENTHGFLQAAYYVATDILVHFSLYLANMGIDYAWQAETNWEMMFRLQHDGKIREISDILQQALRSGLTLLEKGNKSSTRKKADDARLYVDQNYARFDLSLNLVADAVKVNASYLSNIFKKEFQCSLSKYITSVRLKAAEKIMQNNKEKTLIEIAEEVGYSDVYYFSKNFKNYYGITPSRYLDEKRR